MLLLTSPKAGAGHLSASPRDGEKNDYWLRRLDNGGWKIDTVVGAPASEAPKQPLNPQRQAVQAALAAGPKGSEELAISPDAARKRLERMEKDGLVEKLPDGHYQWKSARGPAKNV